MNKKIATFRIDKIISKGETIISNIFLEIFDKELIGIFGSSGVGKTLLLKQLSEYKDKINFLPQNPSEMINPYRTIKDLLFETGAKKSFIEQLVVECELTGVLNLAFSKCSGGQKHRIAILRTLLTDNKLIYIFDEPLAALDFKNKEIILKLFYKVLKESKHTKSIIISTHDLFTIIPFIDKTLELTSNGLIKREISLFKDVVKTYEFLIKEPIDLSPEKIEARIILLNQLKTFLTED